MQLNLTRYWFEFEKKDDLCSSIYMRCGVTAYNYDDAINLLNQYMFNKGNVMPIIKNVIENIDVSTLDANHILPNLGLPPNFRGIWYPQGYNTLNH
jgi:hypothetical protein